jgi:hypothetical protein
VEPPLRAGAATRNTIDAEILAALGPNGIVINAARGSVIDEQVPYLSGAPLAVTILCSYC